MPRRGEQQHCAGGQLGFAGNRPVVVHSLRGFGLEDWLREEGKNVVLGLEVVDS